MAPKRAKGRIRLAWLALPTLVAVAFDASAAQRSLNPFAFGGIDPTSPVAADVANAQRTPGPYPQFSHIPPVPKDVRPLGAWRQAVIDTKAEGAQTQAEAAALVFTLQPGEADSWASAERAKIPAGEMNPPPADAADQAEAFAASARARATPPPSSK
jgi:hypothetical protein